MIRKLGYRLFEEIMFRQGEKIMSGASAVGISDELVRKEEQGAF
jgi:hypothetical protein